MKKQMMLWVGIAQVTCCYAEVRDYNNNVLVPPRRNIVLFNNATNVFQLIKANSPLRQWAVNQRKGNQAGGGVLKLASAAAGTQTVVRAAVVNPDQTLTVAGSIVSGTYILVARLFQNESGTDSSYLNTSNTNTITGNTGAQLITSLVPDLSGGYYLGGYANGGGVTKGILGHVDNQGVFITSFGSNGIQQTLGVTVGYIGGIARQSTGNIVYAGISVLGGNLVVGRVTSSGAIDTTFTIYNATSTGINIPALTNPLGIAVDNQDRIIVVGADLTPNIVVARFNPNGGLDTTFNATGATPGVFKVAGDGYAVALLADNSIIAAGDDNGGAPFNFKIIKVTPQGSLDTTFGNGTGMVTSNPIPGNAGNNANAYAVTVMPNGNIVAVGPAVNAGGAGNTNFGIVMVSPAGVLFPQFFTTGYFAYSFATNPNTNAYTVSYQGGIDPSLVVGGYDAAGAGSAYGLILADPLNG